MCGQLEPTRGLGDFDFKRFKNRSFPFKTFKGDLVTPEPEIQWFSLNQSAEENIAGTTCPKEITVFSPLEHHSFLVVATDGVWDMVSNCAVMQHIAPFFKKTHPLTAEVTQQAADELIRFVRKESRRLKTAMDNTTILILAF